MSQEERAQSANEPKCLVVLRDGLQRALVRVPSSVVAHLEPLRRLDATYRTPSGVSGRSDGQKASARNVRATATHTLSWSPARRVSVLRWGYDWLNLTPWSNSCIRPSAVRSSCPGMVVQPAKGRGRRRRSQCLLVEPTCTSA